MSVTRPCRRAAAALAVTAMAVLALPCATQTAGAGDSLAGTQGINPAPAPTASQVTVHGAGPYSNMAVTVNQTDDLVNQAVGVSWTGATATDSGTSNGQPITFDGTFEDNYVAVFQCWGDAVSDPPAGTDPGPPPTQCESGGSALTATGHYPTPNSQASPYPSATRILDFPNSPTFAADKADAGTSSAPAAVDPTSGDLFEPFSAVDGTTVNVSENPNLAGEGALAQNFWLNPYFSFYTTNEVPYSRTFPDGTGSALFQVDTGLEAPGLGCGQAIEPVPGGAPRVPQCWLVVVPQATVATSPLAPSAWSHRIAIPLSFNRVDESCPLASTARHILGGELAAPAVANWQPTLCNTPGDPSYNYTSVTDDDARAAVPAGTAGTGTMSVYSLPPTTPDPNAVTAPLTLSGVTIGFNIDRVPQLDTAGQPVADEQPIAGSRVGTLNLTPRLVAKLLTESYLGDFAGFAPPKTGTAYDWLDSSDHGGADRANPLTLFDDPDFQQFNPEFAKLSSDFQVTASQLQVELSSSDATEELWNWVLSDPEAEAWLAGQPDPWGMQVNPYYSTSPKINPNGTGFAAGAIPNQFPKSDPYCAPSPDYDINGQPAPAACFTNWSPYSASMQAAALATRVTDIGSKTTPSPNAVDANSYYASDGPETAGQQDVLSVTDTASATRYGLQTASLSAAGDDTATRTFTAPTARTIGAAEQSMTLDPTRTYLEPDVSAKGLYPLPMMTYASVDPTQLDATARSDYTKFLTYAAGPGQAPGDAFGQLPPGYVPLPEALISQDQAAISAINASSPPASSGSTSTVAAPEGSDGQSPTSNSSESPSSTVGPSATGGPAGPIGLTATRAAVPLPRARDAANRSRTPGLEASAARWALPIAILVGMVALLAWSASGRRTNDLLARARGRARRQRRSS